MKLQLNQALPPARESRGIFIRAIISVAGGQQSAVGGRRSAVGGFAERTVFSLILNVECWMLNCGGEAKLRI